MASFSERVTNLSATIAEVNMRRGTHVQISAVLLDQERFNSNLSQPLDSAWNLAVDRKNNLYFDRVKSLLPNAVVEWYCE